MIAKNAEIAKNIGYKSIQNLFMYMVKLEKTLHKIGAVSNLSGVPVPTLRVWETRYEAFSPSKSAGNQRLYTDEDVLRASLLRQLTSRGHAISTLANLDIALLGAMLNKQRLTKDVQLQGTQKSRSVSVVVIGLALAARFQANPHLQRNDGVNFQVTDSLIDLDSALQQSWQSRPDVVLVRINSLHLATHAALRQLIDKHAIANVIVLYSYAQQRVIEAMRLAGIIVRREPINDRDFAELLYSILLIDPRNANDFNKPGVMIPPRKYSDQTLTRVAGISTDVLCECPKHVAELITQLASFELYSQECLNNSHEDAQLHAQLSAISGTARALFERALELVAEHESIDLSIG
ncbi:MerR family transcriptional regulator [Limnohabitans sp.]|uniref:MerR family transcriptional regulator n=1 Tax=Limnohabitans sp. TaxID=1907725 RepID=UPI00311EEFEE